MQNLGDLTAFAPTKPAPHGCYASW
jgi:hypothetical protein